MDALSPDSVLAQLNAIQSDIGIQSPNLALGKTLSEAVILGKEYVTRALKYSLAIGKEQGPVGHWHPLVPSKDSKNLH